MLFLRLVCIWTTLVFGAQAFLIVQQKQTNCGPHLFRSSRLCAAQQPRPPSASRRRELLARKGPHFRLERFTGIIEFGATANLVTRLDNNNSNRGNKNAGQQQANVDNDDSGGESNGIAVWLQDERSLAMSIWDQSLMKEMGNSVYRLEVMPLQFVTLQLAPWVDVEMKTRMDPVTKQPVFTVQSVNYDPNIQLLPGMRISADALGIAIEVAGELRPSADGKGVTGGISFQTTGKLPPPMRVLPEGALKAASDAINQTVVNFAVESFQQGATEMYRDFQRKQQ